MLLRARFCTWLSLVLVCVAVGASSASADVSGADETPAQSYPLATGATVAGAFAGAGDVDYLRVSVSAANESLAFTVQNTTAACNDPNAAGCPVYATLMDGSGTNQVGGDGSGAGTIVTEGDTETFGWTFAAPGTYYLLMESDDDLAPGSPAYSVSLAPVSPSAPSGGSTGGGGSSSTGSGAPTPFLRSLLVRPRQRGSAVRAQLVLGQPARLLRATLLRPHGRRLQVLAGTRAQPVAAGTHRLVLRLPPRLRRRQPRRLSLWVRVTLVPESGRPLTLTRPLTLVR